MGEILSKILRISSHSRARPHYHIKYNLLGVSAYLYFEMPSYTDSIT